MSAPRATVRDLIVIGGGPAGIACALQAWRDGLHVTVLSDEPVGGLLRAARRLDNLPGYPGGVAGVALSGALVQQVVQLGIEVIRAHARELSRRDQRFAVISSDGRRFHCRTVFVATGTAPAYYGAAGFSAVAERGRGHRDVRTVPQNLGATCCLVIGGGDAAFDSALTLADRGAQVVVAVRAQQPRASQRLQRAAERAEIELLQRCVVVGIRLAGEGLSVALHRAEHGAESRDIAHVIACVGREPRVQLLDALCPQGLRLGELTTSTPGLFVGGDLVRGRERFAATAMGDGQRVACMVLEQLQRRERSQDAGAKNRHG